MTTQIVFQNVPAEQEVPFPFATLKAGAVVSGLTWGDHTIEISLDGSNFQATVNFPQEISDGGHLLTLDQSETAFKVAIVRFEPRSGEFDPFFFLLTSALTEIGDAWIETFPPGMSNSTVADAVWDESKSLHTASGSFGQEVQLHALSSEITALNDPSASDIADAVLDEALSGHTTAGTVGEKLGNVSEFDVSTDEVLIATSEVDAIVDGVWDEPLSGHTTSGSAGQALADILVSSVLAEYTVQAGSTDQLVKTDATKATGYYSKSWIVVVDGSDIAMGSTANYSNTDGRFSLERTLPFTPSAGARLFVLGACGVIGDEIPDHVWDETTLAHTQSNTMGGFLLDIFNTNVVKTKTVEAGTTPSALKTNASEADGYWDGHHILIVDSGNRVVRGVESYLNADGTFNLDEDAPFTPSVGAIVRILATGMSADHFADNVWEEDLAEHLADPGTTPAGSALEQTDDTVQANLDATVSSRSTFDHTTDDVTLTTASIDSIVDSVWTETLADHSGTAGSTAEALDGIPTAAGIADAVWDESLASHTGPGIAGDVLADTLNHPTASEITDAVWTEPIADHSGTSGSTAEALSDAAAGGGLTAAGVADAVWDEPSADHLAAGSMGKLLDDAVDTFANKATVVEEMGGTKLVTIFEDDDTTIKYQVRISSDGLTRTRV